jgi:hypothetical protein
MRCDCVTLRRPFSKRLFAHRQSAAGFDKSSSRVEAASPEMDLNCYQVPIQIQLERRILTLASSPTAPRFRRKKSRETKQDARSDSDRALNDVHSRERTGGSPRESMGYPLTPRTRQKKTGRARGSQNYSRSQATDTILVQLVNRRRPANAKRAIVRQLKPFHGRPCG